MKQGSGASAEQQYWAKTVIPDDTSECWIWVGKLARLGYGQIVVYRAPEKPWTTAAHRVGYEIHKGSIPKGLVIDHLCRNPPCVNPSHLEAVTQQENTARGLKDEAHREGLRRRVACQKGHPLVPENISPGTIAACLACERKRSVEKSRRWSTAKVTTPCAVVSPQGRPCQRQIGHEGKHFGQRFEFKIQAPC